MRHNTRIAPATFLVTNIADSGSGSLRDAVNQSNMAAGADSIAFDASFFNPDTPRTIVLSSGDIDISDILTIKGPGRDVLTIDGNSMSRIFQITDSSSATDRPVKILGVTLTGGATASTGGAIYSEESLTVENSAIMGNTATGNGGGIALASSVGSAKLTVKNSIIQANASTAGAGGGIHANTDGGLHCSAGQSGGIQRVIHWRGRLDGNYWIRRRQEFVHRGGIDPIYRRFCGRQRRRCQSLQRSRFRLWKNPRQKVRIF